MQELQLFGREITLSTRMEISDSLSAHVLNNEISALEHDIKLKAIEESIGDARKKIKAKVIEEAIGQKESLGVKFSLSKGSQTLDYSQDPEWLQLEEKKKAREALLKQAWSLNDKNGDQLIINDELIPVVSVKSVTGDSIRYTFSK